MVESSPSGRIVDRSRVLGNAVGASRRPFIRHALGVPETQHGRMFQRLSVFVVLASFSVGGCPAGGGTDGVDAFVPNDGAARTDGHVVADAEVTDAVVVTDAVIVTDAVVVTDAYVLPDATVPADAQVPMDSGTDAGPIDAGSLCDETPCYHGGVCSTSGSTATCTCVSPYVGTNCEQMEVCSGVPLGCAAQTPCAGAPFCTSARTCTGTPAPCAGFGDEVSCAIQTGCTWSSGSGSCGGTPAACSPATCGSGCAEGSACTGSAPGSCSAFSLAACSGIDGCSVAVVAAP